MRSEILKVLSESYPMRFDGLDFIRDSGSAAWAAFSQDKKYFLRTTKPAFADTVLAAEISAFDDFVTIYHFALQATIIEIFGADRADGTFLTASWPGL